MIKNLNIGDRYKKWRNEDYSCAFNLFQISFYLQLFSTNKGYLHPNLSNLEKGKQVDSKSNSVAVTSKKISLTPKKDFAGMVSAKRSN